MAREHRQWGVDLFNATWELIRSREDDDLMLHKAHASAYHWSQAPECTPANRARSHWLVSRVSALAGLPDAALHHANACLRWGRCERAGFPGRMRLLAGLAVGFPPGIADLPDRPFIPRRPRFITIPL